MSGRCAHASLGSAEPTQPRLACHHVAHWRRQGHQLRALRPQVFRPPLCDAHLTAAAAAKCWASTTCRTASASSRLAPTACLLCGTCSPTVCRFVRQADLARAHWHQSPDWNESGSCELCRKPFMWNVSGMWAIRSVSLNRQAGTRTCMRPSDTRAAPLPQVRQGRVWRVLAPHCAPAAVRVRAAGARLHRMRARDCRRRVRVSAPALPLTGRSCIPLAKYFAGPSIHCMAAVDSAPMLITCNADRTISVRVCGAGATSTRCRCGRRSRCWRAGRRPRHSAAAPALLPPLPPQPEPRPSPSPPPRPPRPPLPSSAPRSPTCSRRCSTTTTSVR